MSKERKCITQIKMRYENECNKELRDLEVELLEGWGVYIIALPIKKKEYSSLR